MKKSKRIKVFLYAFFAGISAAILGFKALKNNSNTVLGTSASALADEFDSFNSKNYIELFNEDGSMQMIEELPQQSLAPRRAMKTAANTNFIERKLIDSGKPDSDSLVLTILGDGFTAAEQTTFINIATDMVDHLVGNPTKSIVGIYPFDLYRDYFTVYAIEVVSNQSGVSRDSSPNNHLIIDNYFGSSYYQGTDDPNAIERSMTVENKSGVKELTKKHSITSLVLCNSASRTGGTSLGNGIVVMNCKGTGLDRANVLSHELGHSVGKLADEYYYVDDNKFYTSEYPNRTKESDPSKVKWKDYLGINFSGIPVGIYSYASDLEPYDVGKPIINDTNFWYKPTKNKVCKMQSSSKDFCPVCARAMLDELSDICDYYPIVNGKKCSAPGVNIEVTMTAKDENEDSWFFKIKNNTGQTINFEYNSMTCFENDAREWNNICHIVSTGYINIGASTGDKDIKIKKNGLAETIVISYIMNQKRYIFYAYDLKNNGDMTCKSSTKDESMQVKIVYKSNNKWNLTFTNRTGATRTFFYNKAMCFEGDAKKWSGLTDVEYFTLGNNGTTNITISENVAAGTIVFSYLVGDTRYIYYAYGLHEDKRISSYRSTASAPSYERNNMKLQVVGKYGYTWLVNLTNLTGSSKAFQYNQYLCFEGDAKKWSLGSDVKSTSTIANGQTTSTPLRITENGFAGTMAISYTDGTNRYIAYAYNISTTGSMSAYKNTIPLSSSSDSSQCVTKGTLITLADGSKKKVETLTGNELLLTWNLETGKYEASPILFIDSDPKSNYEVITLTFSDNTKVEVVSEHGFFDSTLNKYVYLDKDAEKYIGHTFFKESDRIKKKVKLKKVMISNKMTKTYSPVTYGNLCYYVNGMLSMPGGIDGLFNYFKVDPKTMMYDKKEMLRDIKKYGLFTFQEFYSIMPIPEEIFNAVNGKYLKVAIGKGLITYEKLEQLVERYSVFF